MMNANLPMIRALLVLLMVVLPCISNAQSPQETLSQYIFELQKIPSDNALREKIIKLALTLNPKPTVSQDVVMHEGAAEYAIKHARSTEDFADAAKEYEQALLLAPWIAADYFNCGIAYEKAEQYAAAIRSFKLYLIAAPGAQDTNEVLKRIGALEYVGHKKAKESTPEAMSAQEQKKSEEWIRNLNGARYAADSRSTLQSFFALMGPVRDVIDIQSNEAIAREMLIRFDDQETARLNPQAHPGEWIEKSRATISNRQFTLQLTRGSWWARLACTINMDGNKVSCVMRDSYGQETSVIYYRNMEP